MKDKALADAVAKQPWDPSVQALAALPDVVKRLADDIQWTTDLGNAFLAQQSDVMDAVQRMRKKAQDTGNLKSTEQQKVETKVIENKSVIVVEQANPQVVYVPSYDPVVVYGPPVYPYPPIYYPPPGYYAAGMAISFGVGVAMGAFWGGGWGWGCGWGGNNNITINSNNNFNRNTNIDGGNRPVATALRGRCPAVLVALVELAVSAVPVVLVVSAALVVSAVLVEPAALAASVARQPPVATACRWQCRRQVAAQSATSRWRSVSRSGDGGPVWWHGSRRFAGEPSGGARQQVGRQGGNLASNRGRRRSAIEPEELG